MELEKFYFVRKFESDLINVTKCGDMNK